MKCKNFLKKLSFILVLFLAKNTFSQEFIIKNGDAWHYYDKGYLDTYWATSIERYNWQKGITPIGYGDETVVTKINFGDDSDNKDLVKYFYKKVDIKDQDYLGYEIRILRDDGAVVYINGKELFRSNMPNGSITRKSVALSTTAGQDELLYQIFVFDTSIFKEGENTIEVSVHQAYPESSDCIFSLELLGHESSEILSKVIDTQYGTNKDLRNQIRGLSAKFEFQKLASQNEILAFSNSSLKNSLLIVALFFVLSLVSIYYIVEDHKRKLKKQDAQFVATLHENENKNREILFLSSKLLNNKQYFKEIKLDLKNIKTSESSILKNIISEIDEVLDNEDEWDIFKKHFDAVCNGFYENLIKLHPDLSETELRHCLFIKLHMQTKEIAKILLIDPRSVQTTRYRIKKKMNLNEEEDLRKYLLNL